MDSRPPEVGPNPPARRRIRSQGKPPNGYIFKLTPIGFMLFLLPIGFKECALKIRSIRDIGAAVRGRRKDLGLNQAELAERAGVSRKWIYEFEAGKPTAEFGLALRVLEELDLSLELHKATDQGHQTASDRRWSVDLDALLDGLQEGEHGRR